LNKLSTTKDQKHDLSPTFSELINHYYVNTQGVTNFFIDDILRDQCPENYVGFFPKNQLPLMTGIGNSIIVVDLNPTFISTTGHFVTIISSPRVCSYLDSLGLPPPTEIAQHMLNTGKKLKILNEQIQPFFSHFCGMYCILFALYFNKRMTGKQVNFSLTFSHANLKKNDQLCVKYIQDLLSIKD